MWFRTKAFAAPSRFKPAAFTAGSRTFSFDRDPCAYFGEGRAKASTISLSVLVMIEMFNSFNALSEDSSLLVVKPWDNPYLLLAVVGSVLSHCFILYTPLMNSVFSIVPLSWDEWKLVLAFAAPVILVDEVLKLIGRTIGRGKRAVQAKDKSA